MDLSWQRLITISDVPSATIMAERLRSAGVDVWVRTDSSLLGQAMPCALMVDAAQMHRARWLLGTDQVTEQELESLSCGRSPDIGSG